MLRTAAYPLVLECMGGLGDNVYARPFVRALAASRAEPVWIRTPWPQLFRDIPNARFIAPWRMGLRTQQYNMHAVPSSTWDTRPPAQAERRRFHYRLEIPGETILREIERGLDLPRNTRIVFDLPDFGPSPVVSTKPVAVLRPVTIRREWANTARNPDAKYVARAAELLRGAGYHTVLVGDVDDRAEPAVEPLPECDETFIRGEFSVDMSMALVQNAAVVVGGIGWIVPTAIAMKTPAVFINGGNGLHNGPAVLTDPRMDLSRCRFVLPDDFCMCSNVKHDCPKTISDFDTRFSAALAEVAC